MLLRSKVFSFLIVFGFLLAVGGCEKQEAGESKAFSSEQPQPYITTSDVRVRSGPGTQYKIVAEIKRGTNVNVVGREGGWLKIISKQGNPPGYIDERYARQGEEQAKKAVTSVQGSYTTMADTYVRKGPGLRYEVVSKIPKDTKVHVVGAEGDWLKVQSKHGNPPGYIEKRYAQRRSDS